MGPKIFVLLVLLAFILAGVTGYAQRPSEAEKKEIAARRWRNGPKKMLYSCASNGDDMREVSHRRGRLIGSAHEYKELVGCNGPASGKYTARSKRELRWDEKPRGAQVRFEWTIFTPAGVVVCRAACRFF